MVFLAACVVAGIGSFAGAKVLPKGRQYTNFIGMKFVRIGPGQFRMGKSEGELSQELLEPEGTHPKGDFDEHPAHKVRITKPFYIGVYEVTNFQYELFKPEHKENRGRAKGDNDAVINVSWYEARAFCRWLSDKDGLCHHPPTEAQWEYACRAGTKTPFHMGNRLSEEFTDEARGSLEVGQFSPNPWGIYDMHGNVEEWCYDWYGPYEADRQVDPVGRLDGDFKVLRGGSHSTAEYYLRSANRLGTLPQDKHSLIGFRVVIGELPRTEPLPEARASNYQLNVNQEIPSDVTEGPDATKPYFCGPRLFMKLPAGDRGPLYEKHNHFVSVVECPNGDLIAVWHTCIGESGRELTVAGSRLRYRSEQWDQASLFWDAPDRNDHGHALWFDGEQKIYHFQGLATLSRDVALIMRTSSDNGVTWSKARILADHGPSRMPVEAVFRMTDGRIAISCDKGPNILWMSDDEAITWFNPGGVIAGKHAAACQLTDGRLFALSREGDIEGMMPESISDDMGNTYEYSASEFQPISWGQRGVLLRLKEGPLFFASFCKRMPVDDKEGGQHEISGLFGAVSYDDGASWPEKRLMTDDGPGRNIQTMDGHPVRLDAYRSEASGYLTVCQGSDRVIHLLSSRQHYAFNLSWLESSPPAVAKRPPEPKTELLPVKGKLANIYVPQQLKEGHRSVYKITEGQAKSLGWGDKELWKIKIDKGNGFYLRSGDSEPFASVDADKGFTAEIKTRILKYSQGYRGVDIELYDGAAARYAVSITDTGVYWYEGFVVGSALLKFGQFTPVAEGLNNTDAFHTYRLAVRDDKVVQIYRDGELIGTRRFEYRTPRGAYIQYGGGRGLEALVEYVSYDISGPYQPAE